MDGGGAREPDAALVREALGGAREPVAELVRRHWNTAVFLAARVLGSTELARDAAQEAAVAVLTDLSQLRSPESFGPWFCGIALNVSRRWRRQLRAEILYSPAESPSDLPGPADAAELAELNARVRTAVATLADGQRQAVWLFYLQGLSHREVAAELGISVGAVKSRLHQARAALAGKLAGEIELTEVTTMATTGTQQWADVTVTEIRRSSDEPADQRKHIMILTERAGGHRRLPVWIGPAEAQAMALTLEAVETPRPFPAKLALGLLDAVGSGVEEVRVTSLLDQVFYASVLVRAPGGVREVDARPSDAVNLALVADVPIRVEASLLEGPPADRYEDAAAAAPVATADIAAEASERLREHLACPPD
jgi:RNA polymerase sigma-70 factor, ECF subfamily